MSLSIVTGPNLIFFPHKYWGNADKTEELEKNMSRI